MPKVVRSPSALQFPVSVSSAGDLSLAESMYIALGGEDQFIYVDPASKTVVVKMSHGPVGPDAEAQEQETLSFLDAASRWKLR